MHSTIAFKSVSGLGWTLHLRLLTVFHHVRSSESLIILFCAHHRSCFVSCLNVVQWVPVFTPQQSSSLADTSGLIAAALKSEIATFASGCFWGVEHIFLKHYPPAQNKGILKTTVGYTGGNPLVKNPDYKTVCTGATDHAEALKIEFDPSVVSYGELVGKCSDLAHRERLRWSFLRVLLSNTRSDNVEPTRG